MAEDKKEFKGGEGVSASARRRRRRRHSGKPAEQKAEAAVVQNREQPAAVKHKTAAPAKEKNPEGRENGHRNRTPAPKAPKAPEVQVRPVVKLAQPEAKPVEKIARPNPKPAKQVKPAEEDPGLLLISRRPPVQKYANFEEYMKHHGGFSAPEDEEDE